MLALGLMGAGAAALFICAHWSIALVGAVAVLVLSAMESEAFLLFVIFLMPFAWVLKGVHVTCLSLCVVWWLLGSSLAGCCGDRHGIRHLFRPAMSRASLLFLCAAVASTILGKGGLTYESVRAVYQLATYVGFYFVVLAWVDSRQRIRKVLWRCCVLRSLRQCLPFTSKLSADIRRYGYTSFRRTSTLCRGTAGAPRSWVTQFASPAISTSFSLSLSHAMCSARASGKSWGGGRLG